MSGEAEHAVYEPGWTGKQVILATIGDFCPGCGSILDIDGPYGVGPRMAAWFASCPARKCRWLCDQSLGTVPWDWTAEPGGENQVTA